MITIIHGDDTAKSRKFFFDEKERYKDSVLLDGEKITLTDLTQIFEGGGLFSEMKTVFIEQFFNRKKKKEEFALFATYLQKQSSNTIFLWEGKELDRGALASFKTAVPRVFKLPQTLFLFLDSIRPGNGKQLIVLFHQTIAVTEAEMVFFMLVRQVRLLLAVNPSQPPLVRGGGSFSPLDKGESEGVIDELKRLAPWQKSKLEKQAELFGKEKLQEFYAKLFAIEVAQKTGGLASPLSATIDFLLLEI